MAQIDQSNMDQPVKKAGKARSAINYMATLLNGLMGYLSSPLDADEQTAFRNGINAPSKSGGGATGTWSIGISGNASTVTSITSGHVTDALGFTPLDAAEKGATNGVAPLVGGFVPAGNLPSYVDDVVEVEDFASLPVTGETGKIYVLEEEHTTVEGTTHQFRWSGSTYIPIISAPGSTDAVAEGSNLYFTTARVLGTVLAGISFVTSTAVTAADTVLVGIGKLQAQVTALNSSKESSIAAGSTAQYWRGDKTWVAFAADVLGTALTGLSVLSATVVEATDTVLVGIGKLQAQVSGLRADVDALAIGSSEFLSPVVVTISTAAATAAKTGTASDDAVSGRVYVLEFTNSNTAASPTLAINGGSAYPLKLSGANGNNVTVTGSSILVWFDGAEFQLFGSQSSRLNQGASADIASASTLDLTTRDGNVVRVTGTNAITAVTLPNGEQVFVIADGALPLTYHATNMPLPGGASYTCSAGDAVLFTRDRTGALNIQIFKKNALNGTAFVSTQATTSGSEKTWSVPTGVRRIAIHLLSVTPSVDSVLYVRIGTGGVVATTGYATTSGVFNGSNATATTTATTGFIAVGITAATTLSGTFILELVDPSTDIWTCSANLAGSNAASYLVAGYVDLSGAANIVALGCGVGAFDGGNASVTYSY